MRGVRGATCVPLSPSPSLCVRVAMVTTRTYSCASIKERSAPASSVSRISRSLHATMLVFLAGARLCLPLFSSLFTSFGSALVSAAPLSHLRFCSALVSVFCSALVFACLAATSLPLVRRVRPQHLHTRKTYEFTEGCIS